MKNYRAELFSAFNTVTDPKYKETFSELKKLMINEPVFILPEGGAILQDPKFKALSSEKTQVKLPFNGCCFQFDGDMFSRRLESFCGNEKYPNSKNLIRFSHSSPICDSSVLVEHYIKTGERSPWALIAVVAIRLDKLIYRSDDGAISLGDGEVISTSIYSITDTLVDHGASYTKEEIALLPSDYTGFLASFLNVYCLENISPELVDLRNKHEKSHGQIDEVFSKIYTLKLNLPVKTNKPKGAEEREDKQERREHLRRGHIRRLDDGRRIWVNAAIINAGSIKGYVRKDYNLKAA